MAHVWKSGLEYAFTFDEAVHLPAGRDWVCLGRMTWWVAGDQFVHEVKNSREETWTSWQH